jgi:glycosyltransferase involved in cell wall biosynthesis
MKISVITPNYNGEQYLEECIRSVISQRSDGIDLEYIVMDGGSKDGSLDIIRKYEPDISRAISEPDRGPTDAINKGLRLATGEIIGWLNADDRYYPGALERVVRVMTDHPSKALCFGHCPIINEEGREIRTGITRFKECFFPISSRFTIQCINYISQPATFFRRAAYEKAGPLREDLKAAFDYDFFLRSWRHGGAVCLDNPPLAAFRWHESSISGRQFRVQFKEEWDAAVRDAGLFSLQALLHLGVRWGIVLCYSIMADLRRRRGRNG